jgi:HEAT repeat protein
MLSICFLCCFSHRVCGTEVNKNLADLQSSDVSTRVKAATALAQAHDIEGVRAALKDNDAKVRHEAIYHLSILLPMSQEGDPKAEAIFTDCLKDRDALVRQTAVRQLERYGTDRDPDIWP